MSLEVMTGMNATAAQTSLEKEWAEAKEKKESQQFYCFLFLAVCFLVGVLLILSANSSFGMFLLGVLIVVVSVICLPNIEIIINVTLTDYSTYEWWKNICGQDSSRVRVIIDDVLASAEKGAALNQSQKAILGSLQKSAVASASEGEFPTQSHKEIALRVLRITLSEAEKLPTTS